MDRYKFHGKRLDNGEWVEGCYVWYEVLFSDNEDDRQHYIIVDGFKPIEVDPATVGQYTGKQDDDKTDVFEHDIVIDFLDGNFYLVVWDSDSAAFLLKPNKGDWMDFETFEERASIGYRVVGNKFDNPELLEG